MEAAAVPTTSALAQSHVLYGQIDKGVLMALGAHHIRVAPIGDRAAVQFSARILTRPGGQVRIMRVTVTLAAFDTYEIVVDYPKRGSLVERVEHRRFDDVYVDVLNRVLLSLDQVE